MQVSLLVSDTLLTTKVILLTLPCKAMILRLPMFKVKH